MPQQRKAAAEAICVDGDETAAPADLSLRLSSEEPDDIAVQPGQASQPAARSTCEDVAQQQKAAALSESVPITRPLIHMNPLLMEPLHAPSHQVASSPELPFPEPCSKLLQHATVTPLAAAQPARAASLSAPANLHTRTALPHTDFSHMLGTAPVAKRQKVHLSPPPGIAVAHVDASHLHSRASQHPHHGLHPPAAAACHVGAASFQKAAAGALTPASTIQSPGDKVVDMFTTTSPKSRSTLLQPEGPASWLWKAEAMGIRADSEASAKVAIANALKAQGCTKSSAAVQHCHAYESANSLQTAEAESSKLGVSHTRLYNKPVMASQSAAIDLVADDNEDDMRNAVSAQAEYDQMHRDATLAAQMQVDEHAGHQLADLKVSQFHCHSVTKPVAVVTRYDGSTEE